MRTFFLASAGASSAYLTVSEIFPMETRALAIAFFYAVGTAVGGITGPLLFGHLIDSGSASQLAIGFFIGAAAMALGGLAEMLFGVDAEQQSLESIAEPLTPPAPRPAATSAASQWTRATRPAAAREGFAALPAWSRVVALVLAVHADDGRPPSDRELQREIDLIVRTLAQQGQLERAVARARGRGALLGAWPAQRRPARSHGAGPRHTNVAAHVRTARRLACAQATTVNATRGHPGSQIGSEKTR